MKKILIVEDNEKNMKLVRDILRHQGHATLEAATGTEGVRLALEESPDLILMDIQLPDIDGFDVAARLTGTDGAPTVILVSSRDGSDFGPLVTRSGARGFVPKAELSGDRVQALLP